MTAIEKILQTDFTEAKVFVEYSNIINDGASIRQRLIYDIDTGEDRYTFRFLLKAANGVLCDPDDCRLVELNGNTLELQVDGDVYSHVAKCYAAYIEKQEGMDVFDLLESKERLPREEVRRLMDSWSREVRWSEEDGCYVGSLPELCGDCCDGESIREVLERLDEVALDYAEERVNPNWRWSEFQEEW